MNGAKLCISATYILWSQWTKTFVNIYSSPKYSKQMILSYGWPGEG